MGLDVGEADRLLMTTRSVPQVRDALTVAVQAPTGGGDQDWRWLVVTDAATRAAIGDVYWRASQAIQPAAADQDSAEAQPASALTEHLGVDKVVRFGWWE
jgi:nitroreductase